LRQWLLRQLHPFLCCARLLCPPRSATCRGDGRGSAAQAPQREVLRGQPRGQRRARPALGRPGPRVPPPLASASAPSHLPGRRQQLRAPMTRRGRQPQPPGPSRRPAGAAAGRTLSAKASGSLLVICLRRSSTSAWHSTRLEHARQAQAPPQYWPAAKHSQ
jgi:hypothetical protein